MYKNKFFGCVLKSKTSSIHKFGSCRQYWTPGVAPINIFKYNSLMKRMKEFCYKKQFVEMPAQNNNLQLVAACEDPFNVVMSKHQGEIWPEPQSAQMNEEFAIMHYPFVDGVFCISTSTRDEDRVDSDRYFYKFPMLEVEFWGKLSNLINFQKELLEYLGFGPRDSFPELYYTDLMKQYGVKELTHEHEDRMCKDYGPIVFLKQFPDFTDPYWNMNNTDPEDLRDPNIPCSDKVDGIFYGREASGGAQRSCDPKKMMENFEQIVNGEFAKMMYNKFGRIRVLSELESYHSLKFKVRSGVGFGISRVIRAVQLAGLYDQWFEEDYDKNIVNELKSMNLD